MFANRIKLLIGRLQQQQQQF